MRRPYGVPYLPRRFFCFGQPRATPSATTSTPDQLRVQRVFHNLQRIIDQEGRMSTVANSNAMRRWSRGE